MGAALFLGETIGWRRWVAIFVGFIGALIIIRPGLVGFELGAIFMLLAVLGQSTRDLLTRVASRITSTVRIGLYGVTSLMILGVLMMIFGDKPVMPQTQDLIFAAIMMITGNVGYHLLNLSIRATDVSIVVPFRYSRIVFGILGGVIVFGERPDIWTLIGGAIIVGSGLFVMLRERYSRSSS